MRKSEIIMFCFVLFSFILTIYFYPLMPQEIATHWDIYGKVNGYSSKFLGLFLIPIMLTVLTMLFVLIPKIDPLKGNISKFRKYYSLFVILFLLFMVLIQAYIILWNLGIKFNPNTIFPILIGVLFYYTGILMQNSKRNWFIGIRNPWTLSSDKVWDKTHKIGGELFKFAAIILVIGIFFQKYFFYLIIIPVILIIIFTFIYSYLEYKKIKPNKKINKE